MNKKSILTFIVVFLVINFIFNYFFHGSDSTPTDTSNYTIATSKKEYGQDDLVEVKIKNNTKTQATVTNDCPAEPLSVSAYVNNAWTPKTVSAEIKCPQVGNTILKPGEETSIKYSSWNHMLFGDVGRYKISATITPDDGTPPVTLESPEFEVKPQGWFGIAWHTVVYQPLFNALIFIASILPNHDFGWSIILFTILIRTLLLVPSQKALKSQRKMQELQPKLNRIREKYADNQEMIAKETMELWKENKVNPAGSCLPLLIQFPILIAIYQVIQNGLNPDNHYLLYTALQNFSLSNVSVNFLGILDLTSINTFVLPLIIGTLQFLQMRLAIYRAEKNKVKTDDKDKSAKKSETEIANQMMIYVMPVMIALFTASAPAGIGLYWGISTLYGIFQQLVVNRQVDTEKVKVKVVN